VKTQGDFDNTIVSLSRVQQAGTLAVCVVLLTMWFYSGVLWHQPILLDDMDYIFNNQGVKQGLSLGTLKWALTTGEQANWHPLTWLSHALDWQLYGAWPVGHFATNILLHSFNAGLVMLLLFRLTASVWRSLIVALLFALHPMHVESVAWLSQRKELLACFFALLSIWCYVDFVRQHRTRQYVLFTVCFALSLMAKQSWVTLPLLVLLLDYWPLKRIKGASEKLPYAQEDSDIIKPLPDEPTQKWWVLRLPSASLVYEKGIVFLIAFLACLAAFVAQKTGGAVRNLDDVSLGFRLQNGLMNYVEFLRKAVWPSPIAVYYPLPASIPTVYWLGALAFLVAASWAAIRLRSKVPWVTVGWLWFIIGLLPVVGFVQLSDQATADRYSYMPYLGLFIAAAWFLPFTWAQQSSTRVAIVAGAITIVMTCMAWITWMTIDEWKNTRTLFTAAGAKTDDNHLAFAILATQDIYDGRTGQALSNINIALAIKPESPRINLAAGRVYLRAGKPDEAIVHLQKVLDANPNSIAGNFDMAQALEASNQPEQALARFTRVAQLSPGNVPARIRLVRLLVDPRFRDLDQAHAYALESTQKAPANPQAWDALGRVMALKQDWAQAVYCFQKVLEFDPCNEQAKILLQKSQSALTQ
jgi:protein O-mannosyl-transferase